MMINKYTNDTKRCARCWCWNQVEQRVAKGSLVLVLIGDTDEELRESVKRGFKVVGIDNIDDKVKAWRKSGGIGICDEFKQQLICMKPDAIIFDGVSGLTRQNLSIVFHAAVTCKAIVWNGLRGRDALSTGVKECRSDLEIAVHRKGKFCEWRQAGIHRAMLLYAWQLFQYIQTFEHEHYEDFPWPIDLLRSKKEVRLAYLAANFMNVFQGTHKPEFMSYRSKDSGQYFDSGAWTCSPGFSGMSKSLRCVTLKSKRKAAAAKALLTMSSE